MWNILQVTNNTDSNLSIQSSNANTSFVLISLGNIAGVSKLQLMDQIQSGTCVVNKVLLDHSHAHLFTHYLWLLPRVELLTQRPSGHKAQNIYCWAF